MSDAEPGLGRRYLAETRYRREDMGRRGPLLSPGAPLQGLSQGRPASAPGPRGRAPAGGPVAVPGPAPFPAQLSRPAPDPGRIGRPALGHPGGNLRQPRLSACGPLPPPGPSTRWRPTWRCTGWRGWSRASGTSGCRTLPWNCFRPATAARPWWGPGLSQGFLGAAGAVFIWTGVLNRARWKYRERAIRYLFLDAGHICQNLMLAATALDLGVCPVGAFFDGEVERLVQVDGRRKWPSTWPQWGRYETVCSVQFSVR